MLNVLILRHDSQNFEREAMSEKNLNINERKVESIYFTVFSRKGESQIWVKGVSPIVFSYYTSENCNMNTMFDEVFITFKMNLTYWIGKSCIKSYNYSAIYKNNFVFDFFEFKIWNLTLHIHVSSGIPNSMLSVFNASFQILISDGSCTKNVYTRFNLL